MGHKFVVMQNGKLLHFDDWQKIPENFDHLIEFVPEIPPGPHTDQQHKEIEEWGNVFAQLMEIENASSSQTR